ncbi:MAG TPA: hypothetical protein VLH13_04555, partial [Methanomassiliicoccales archaeon]|nr:hypothetical protein [Methanomassiliicoccales archaeon]
WAVKDLDMVRSRPRMSKMFYVVALLINLVVLAEGLFLTLNARHVHFVGGESYGPVAVALLAGQLFALGAMAALLWFHKWREGTNVLAWMAGHVSSIGLVTFGAIIMGCANFVTGTALNGFTKATMYSGGSMLLLLGSIPLIAWLFDSLTLEKRPVALVRRLLGWAAPICMVVLIVGTIALSGLADDFRIRDTFKGSKLLMVAFSAFLFMLASLALASWMVRRRPLVRSFVFDTLGIVSGILVAAEGVAVFGMAGETTIKGIGTLPHFIIQMIGAQLILLGLAIGLVWIISGHRFFSAGIKRTMLDGLIYLLTALVVVDGLAGLSIKGQLSIQGIGTILESTMVLFTAQLALLGLISLFVWIFRSDGPTPMMKRFGFLAWLFLALMLPAALLL